MIDFIGSGFPGANPVLLIAMDVALKATILLALGYTVHAMLGRGRALARSALWNAMLIALIVLPLVSLMFPRLRVRRTARRNGARHGSFTCFPACRPPENSGISYSDDRSAVAPPSASQPVDRDENSIVATDPMQTAPVAMERDTPTPSAIAAAAPSIQSPSEKRVGVAGIGAALYVIVVLFPGVQAGCLALGRARSDASMRAG